MSTDALISSFVLGYHGCDQATADALIGGADFTYSRNDHDWLGPGIYFWEANPKRGLEWAAELARRPRGAPRVRQPAVVGAIIELGLCLDLATTGGLEQVRAAHQQLTKMAMEIGAKLPTNSEDLLRRNLDCAVIKTLHEIRDQHGDPPLDSVRGVLVEGEPIFPSSGFHAKTHIQVCVCNPARIKGVFRVPRRFLA